jgi:cation diffusion facilitator family transporter
MHSHSLGHWTHDHSFTQPNNSGAEKRTWIVVAITAVFMVVEIGAGSLFGSMALLADGLHMASHVAALSIAAYAYVYARSRAGDARFSYGTGKITALAGFASAVLLAAFAFFMILESVQRLFSPVAIAFNEAIIVAVVGLLANAISVVILKPEDHSHDHGHDHAHEHEHHHHHQDHNIKAAYMHVIADALTSILAIVALISGKYLGWVWLDPVIGVVGAAVILRWSWGLVRDASGMLLDHQAPARMVEAVRGAIEKGTGDNVTDLHIWSISPGTWAGAIALVTDKPQAPEHYKSLVTAAADIDHLTVEVHACPGPH